jgi:hypothetical protein
MSFVTKVNPYIRWIAQACRMHGLRAPRLSAAPRPVPGAALGPSSDACRFSRPRAATAATRYRAPFVLSVSRTPLRQWWWCRGTAVAPDAVLTSTSCVSSPRFPFAVAADIFVIAGDDSEKVALRLEEFAKTNMSIANGTSAANIGVTLGVKCYGAKTLAFDKRFKDHASAWTSGTFVRDRFPFVDLAVIGIDSPAFSHHSIVPMDSWEDPRTPLSENLLAASSPPALIGAWSGRRCDALVGPLGRENVTCVPFGSGWSTCSRDAGSGLHAPAEAGAAVGALVAVSSFGVISSGPDVLPWSTRSPLYCSNYSFPVGLYTRVGPYRKLIAEWIVSVSAFASQVRTARPRTTACPG